MLALQVPSLQSSKKKKKKARRGECIFEVFPNDVLFGRGSGPNAHQGNIQFRQLVLKRKKEYSLTSNRQTKVVIASEIVDQVYQTGGRFLRKLDDVDAAMELPHMLQTLGMQQGGYDEDDFDNYVQRDVYEIQDDFTALEKAKQALRQNHEPKCRSRLSRSPTNGRGGSRSPVMFRSSNIGGRRGRSPTVGSNLTKNSQSRSKTPPENGLLGDGGDNANATGSATISPIPTTKNQYFNDWNNSGTVPTAFNGLSSNKNNNNDNDSKLISSSDHGLSTTGNKKDEEELPIVNNNNASPMPLVPQLFPNNQQQQQNQQKHPQQDSYEQFSLQQQQQQKHKLLSPIIASLSQSQSQSQQSSTKVLQSFMQQQLEQLQQKQKMQDERHQLEKERYKKRQAELEERKRSLRKQLELELEQEQLQAVKKKTGKGNDNRKQQQVQKQQPTTQQQHHHRTQQQQKDPSAVLDEFAMYTTDIKGANNDDNYSTQSIGTILHSLEDISLKDGGLKDSDSHTSMGTIDNINIAGANNMIVGGLLSTTVSAISMLSIDSMDTMFGTSAINKRGGNDNEVFSSHQNASWKNYKEPRMLHCTS